MSRKPRYTFQQWEAICNKIHNNKYKYHENTYNGLSSKTKITCPIHGDFWQSAKSHFKGHNCQKCYHEGRDPYISADEWIIRCNKIHNNRFIYIPETYRGTGYTTEIICSVHGKYTQNAGVHMRGFGCKLCSIEQQGLKKRNTTKYFIETAAKKHNNRYTYNNTIYITAHTPVTITCPIHGDFLQKPNYHLSGHGCQKCAKSKYTYKSRPEYELIDFFRNIGVDNIVHSYTQLHKEIDIFLYNYNIGIEYNGTYWHSCLSFDKEAHYRKMHQNKTNLCQKNNIDLLHCFEFEWTNTIQNQIWKSIFLNKIKKSKYYIDNINTSVINVNKDNAKLFFDHCHLSGYLPADHTLVLNHNNNIAYAISYNVIDNNCYILQYCPNNFFSIRNGFAIILDFIIKQKYNNIFLTVDRRYQNFNNLYRYGFSLNKIIPPKYYIVYKKTIYPPNYFNYYNIKNLLENYQKSLNLNENLYHNKCSKIWNSGYYQYIMEL